MKLWIRTQDKTQLLQVEFVNFYEGYDPIDEYDGFTTHEIWANEEEIELGKYKSKERCLEIIDEIQLLLENNGSIDDRISQAISKIKNEFIVYEMPQE
jgi:hypothetical protein